MGARVLRRPKDRISGRGLCQRARPAHVRLAESAVSGENVPCPWEAERKTIPNSYSWRRSTCPIGSRSRTLSCRRSARFSDRLMVILGEAVMEEIEKAESEGGNMTALQLGTLDALTKHLSGALTACVTTVRKLSSLPE